MLPNDETKKQMTLFDVPAEKKAVKKKPAAVVAAKKVPRKEKEPAKRSSMIASTMEKTPARAKKSLAKPGRSAEPIKGGSGQIPEGDVRLTANIRQDLHLKLKIAAAHRRTTIGELIEELVEKYL